MKNISNKRKIMMAVFGSIIIVTSSSAILANSLSRRNELSIKLSNNYEFTKSKLVRERFLKANIPSEMTEDYLNELEKIKLLPNYYSNIGGSDFLDSNFAIQNEISSRLVTENYSEKKVRMEIGFVKDILIQNVLAYENITDRENYKDLSRIEFFKYNFEEWSNLNQIDKYKLIYDYSKSVEDVLTTSQELKELKKKILLRKIENNLNIISSNKIRINEIDDLTKNLGGEIKKLKIEKENIESVLSEIDKLIKFLGFAKAAALAEMIISEIAGTATVALNALSIFLPIFVASALASSLIHKGTALAYEASVDLMGQKFEKTYYDLKILYTLVPLVFTLPSTINKLWNITNNFSSYVKDAAKTIDRSIALLTVVTTLYTMITMGIQWENMNSDFNGIINELNSEKNISAKKDLEKIDEKITEINYESSKLFRESSDLKINNLEMESLNRGFEDEINYLETEFSNIDQIFSNGNIVRINKVSEVKEANSHLYSDAELIEKFLKLKSKLAQQLEIKKNKLNSFRIEYSYSDRNYWNDIFDNIYEQKISKLVNVLER
ncbi:hypothetical protein [Spiroplasma alleghenense]|uniref:Transmembrane protein n=1 Tax=Spiroplasma alleghenense TaxID=216931 RepID=A0A345Z4N9_9MOLU|nr:hypothetical protein [Spiroplasma alleghenense]AXK51568.1 hypothetical protein SALLE_v1c08980 [Spiroplasma alleghenense]